MQYFNFTSTDGKTVTSGVTTVSASQPAVYGGKTYTDPVAFFRSVYSDPTATVTLSASQPVSVTELVNYATAKRDALLAAGITVNVAPSGSPAVPILADATVSSRSDLLALYVLASGSSAFTAEWTDNNNVSTRLTAAEILVLSPAIMAWYQRMIGALSSAIAAIEAGTITTTAQIDAITWPSA